MAALVYESSTCHFCDKICLTDAVLCDLCTTWLHSKCLKFSKKQLRILSSDNTPFYCSKCSSAIFPFSNITNTELLDLFNSTVPDKTIHLNCYKCLKTITRNHITVTCKLNKHHHFHLKCAKMSSSCNEINDALWSCKDCLLFPFHDLNNNYLSNQSTPSTKPKRLSKIKLINKLTNLNKHLPKLSIPDPDDDETDSFFEL